MNPVRRLARFFLFLILSTLAAAADLPRIAVVPDSPDPSIAAFADFLSVSLASASNQYTLLERAEITMLAAEAEIQKLTADQRPSALAKLAKADGLIIVGADKGDPKLPKFTLRLTSTHNGLVLHSLILGGKESEYPEAAQLAAGVLRFPCQRLTCGSTKPPLIVSLLGLRPAFETDHALETTLNLAVAQQLSAQSGIAVSERWKMKNLVFERSLEDAPTQAFTTGTVLLDGSYTRKGDELEVILRLRKAESDEGKKIELKGSATQATALAQQIAKLVAIGSGQSGEAVPWDTMAEAQQYADLGWWLLKRNLSEESIGAYETAVALGLERGVVSAGLLQAYQNIMCHSDVGIPLYRTRVDGWDKLAKPEFNQKLINSIRMSQLNIEAIDTKLGGAAHKEFSKLVDPSFTLMVSVAVNMKVLQALCLRGEQLELAAEARILRALSRELMEKAQAKKFYQASFTIVQLGYMFDTPEDAAADLRKRLQPEFLNANNFINGKNLRNELWATSHDSLLWRLVDWSSTDNFRGRTAWEKFIKELESSDSMIERSDGLALAYQSSNDPNERENILSSYCTLLESNFNELLTPGGQMSFSCFEWYYSYGISRREQHPAYELRMAKILTRILESGKILEPATISMLYGSVKNWCRENTKGNTIISDVLASSTLHLIEHYIETKNPDSQSTTDFDNRNRILKEISGLLIQAYPRIKEQGITSRPVEVGAVPIQAWKPELPGSVSSKIQMDCNHMIASGDSLLIPSRKHGIIDLNVRTLSVSRVMELPFPNTRFIGGFTKNDTSLMINVEQRLFITPLASDGKSWNELFIPDVKTEDQLTWHIQGMGSEFFVGSGMRDIYSATSRMMLAGTVREGKLTWEVSSKRRPAVNQIDKMDPLEARCAYRNPKGNTMVLFEGLWSNWSLVELETGREVFSARSRGAVLSKGEIPLCVYSGSRIQFLAAFDPELESPRFLFEGCYGSHGNYELPKKWKNTRPRYDLRRPEFLGQWISIIFHDGYLWLLKREPEAPEKFERNDPQAFRLVRMDLNGGDPLVIPLRYDVPVDLRKFGEHPKTSMERPIINYESLTATSKGLFFAGSGHDYTFSYAMTEWGRTPSGDDVPMLLYITWEDINAWLAKKAK